MNKKVLIICFTFPPYPGIGGRRWAKFAKYLHREGVDIQVIAAKKKLESVSSWINDIQEYADRITYLPTNYPISLTVTPKTILDKIKYRLSLIYVKLFSKGNYYDPSIFWKKTLLKEVEKRIKEGYGNLIVSCAPFTTAFHLIEIKKKYPNVNFIIDFRDGWTWDNRFGLASILESRLNVEKTKEKNVVLFADRIFIPADFMFEILNDKYPEFKNKLKLLPHTYDVDEMPTKSATKGTHLIYGGTLYDGMEDVFKSLNNSYRESVSKPDIHLYLQNPDKLKYYLSFIDTPYKKHFILKNQLSPNEFYKEVSEARAFLFWAGTNIKLSLTSKVFEILYSNTMLVVISDNCSELSDFLVSNSLGCVFEPSEFSLDKIVDIQCVRDRFLDLPLEFEDFQGLTKSIVKEELI